MPPRLWRFAVTVSDIDALLQVRVGAPGSTGRKSIGSRRRRPLYGAAAEMIKLAGVALQTRLVRHRQPIFNPFEFARAVATRKSRPIAGKAAPWQANKRTRPEPLLASRTNGRGGRKQSSYGRGAYAGRGACSSSGGWNCSLF